MPAGNDAKAALAELADQFGEGVGRAEDLIQASRSRYSGDLGAAQSLPRDQEATDELDHAEVAKTAGLKQADLIDAAVRGEYVVYVYVGDDDRTEKGCFRQSDLGKAASKVEKADTGEVEHPRQEELDQPDPSKQKRRSGGSRRKSGSRKSGAKAQKS